MFEDIAGIYLTHPLPKVFYNYTVCTDKVLQRMYFWAYPLVKTILDGTTFYS